MKKMKRLVALALSVVMVLAMSVFAFAAEKTYTITAPDNDHTYEIYQIFTGDLSEDGTTLSNVKWGKMVQEQRERLLLRVFSMN